MVSYSNLGRWKFPGCGHGALAQLTASSWRGLQGPSVKLNSHCPLDTYRKRITHVMQANKTVMLAFGCLYILVWISTAHIFWCPVLRGSYTTAF